MTQILTSAQMRGIETAAIETGRVTGLELMERAGRGVISAVFAQWPDLAAAPRRAVVACGPGNNGGDGFVIARLLNDWGWDVAVYLYGDPAQLPQDAGKNRDRWARLGAVGTLADAPGCADDADLFVDALFGTGLGRPLEGAARDWATALAGDPAASARTVAVDIPSGLCADSGRTLAEGAAAVRAALTVSFHAPKLGHYLAMGPSLCGKTVVADIGLEKGQTDTARLVIAPGAAALGKRTDGHKYDHGHALVLAGGPGRGGAGRLAARAALRVGAGLVTVGCPPAALQENAARLDAVMLRPVGSDEDLRLWLAGDQRLTAVCLGPGLGTGAREQALVGAVLDSGRAAVLDADALSLVAGDKALFQALHRNCVLTPHAGEFARLFPDIAKRLAKVPSGGPAYSRLDAAREAAARVGATVLIKGPDTVIAGPDGQAAVSAAVYDRAAPWLATAGSGDVLAGFIAGLLARGLPPMPAAEAAAWLHVETARAFGPGLIAEDLPDALPGVFRALGL